jgi:hypothetical protein
MYPIVVDNFFNNPDSIRNYALSLNYEEPNKLIFDGWLGYRSFDYDKKFAEYFLNNINNYILEDINIFNFRYHFHYSLKKTKQTAPCDFDEYKIHSDSERGCYFAGLVYLHPNPPPNTGTSFYSNSQDDSDYQFSINNKYNRLVCYPSIILHGPTNLFGDSKENGRLTLTFFCFK